MNKIGLSWIFLAMPAFVQAQIPSPEKLKIVSEARSQYYNLEVKGLTSFQCQVDFDLHTLPEQILPETAIDDRKILKSMVLTLKVNHEGTHLEYSHRPSTMSSQAEQAANIIQSLVSGFWMTWPTKGLNGPIPPFDKWVKQIQVLPSGYEVSADSALASGLQSIFLDKDLHVTRILSVGGKVDERPAYVQTADGLVYSGLDATSEDQSGGKTVVHFEIESALVDGFHLPQQVHMKVNDNLNVRFVMSACSAKKANAVLKISPQ
jgi:hypothetical protein